MDHEEKQKKLEEEKQDDNEIKRNVSKDWEKEKKKIPYLKPYRWHKKRKKKGEEKEE